MIIVNNKEKNKKANHLFIFFLNLFFFQTIFFYLEDIFKKYLEVFCNVYKKKMFNKNF